MNYRAVWIILAISAVISFGQTANRAAPVPAKLDTWQKSKECAAQAEKIMTELDHRGDVAMHWENHYSPKYDRCFISATYVIHSKEDGRTASIFTTQLIDAFERSVLANSAVVADPNSHFCDIDQKHTDCTRAATFISEHMKN